jgi:hypothetical protein
MYKGAVLATVMALLNPAAAAAVGASVPDPAQANWHGGGHRGGGGGQGGGGNGGGDGGVIVNLPYPSGPEAPSPYPSGPYPYPGLAPSLPASAGSNAAGRPRPWPVWYYCDQPGGYYPYVKVCGHDWQRLPVMPPPPGSAAPIAEGLWQRCDDPAGYFPYVAQCRDHWIATAASSPVPGDDPEGIALIGQWFYCDDAKDYLPYAGSCPHIWRIIPAVPPPNAQSAKKINGSG